ncbi:hypothetical protein KOW79_018588 [Hemibagrus wyckioides]|uniref:Uncharacterized protein n=1 Tax=Hemibagrus wyckioides TaxID=337641 RepID=A0A9D3SFA6_9TELE|nr:hypothetical protein KOW79_018588 [Hemibagrus wyckioides]
MAASMLKVKRGRLFLTELQRRPDPQRLQAAACNALHASLLQDHTQPREHCNHASVSRTDTEKTDEAVVRWPPEARDGVRQRPLSPLLGRGKGKNESG